MAGIVSPHGNPILDDFSSGATMGSNWDGWKLNSPFDWPIVSGAVPVTGNAQFQATYRVSPSPAPVDMFVSCSGYSSVADDLEVGLINRIDGGFTGYEVWWQASVLRLHLARYDAAQQFTDMGYVNVALGATFRLALSIEADYKTMTVWYVIGTGNLWQAAFSIVDPVPFLTGPLYGVLWTTDTVTWDHFGGGVYDVPPPVGNWPLNRRWPHSPQLDLLCTPAAPVAKSLRPDVNYYGIPAPPLTGGRREKRPGIY